jgi:hypothetical protein
MDLNHENNSIFINAIILQIAPTAFDDSRLKITVYDCENNALKHYIPIGSIVFPLREYTICKQHKLIVWRDLKRHAKEEVKKLLFLLFVTFLKLLINLMGDSALA